jgi:hypothetical protein
MIDHGCLRLVGLGAVVVGSGGRRESIHALVRRNEGTDTYSNERQSMRRWNPRFLSGKLHATELRSKGHIRGVATANRSRYPLPLKIHKSAKYVYLLVRPPCAGIAFTEDANLSNGVDGGFGHSSFGWQVRTTAQ